MRERERLIARIRQIRRLSAARNRPDRPEARPADSEADRLQTLEARVAHLERLVEGLQDSVHRESDRLAGQIAELQTQVRPGTMSAALAEDARNRGL
jgi:cell division protein FtsB